MNASRSSPSCFICVSSPILFIVQFIFAVKTYCYHSRPSSTPSFYNSILLSRGAFIFTVILTIKSCLSISITGIENFNQFLTSLLIVVDTFTISFILINVQFTQTKQIIHFNGVLLITKKKIGSDRIVDETFQNKIYSIILQYCIPFFTIILIIIFRILFSSKNWDAEIIFQVVTVLGIFLINMSLFVSVLFSLEIYLLLFKKCYLEIKNILTQTNVKNLTKDIKELQKFHHSIFVNFHLLCRIFNTHAMLFLFCGCLVLVGNFYLFVSYIQEHQPYTIEELIRFVLCFLGIFGSLIILFKIQDLRDQVRRFGFIGV